MKRLSYIIILITAVSAFISCEHVLCVDGAWDPMELDKTHVNFPSEGGQNTVSVLNYTLWWIVGGYTSVNEIGAQDTLDGGWYHLTVPDKCKSNAVIVTVEPNDGEARHTIIQMQSGNAFTTFSISQE
jgi:hypothetical protein